MSDRIFHRTSAYNCDTNISWYKQPATSGHWSVVTQLYEYINSYFTSKVVLQDTISSSYEFFDSLLEIPAQIQDRIQSIDNSTSASPHSIVYLVC